MRPSTATDVYADLGMRRVVNAAATLTRLGGSIMPRPVIEAMIQASRSFVDLPELQRRCGERLAKLTKNEAAYVCSGAAAGLTLTTAACVTGVDPAKIARLPSNLGGLKNEVIVHRCQRNGYDFAVRQAGVTIVEIGFPGVTQAWELEAAISDRTAAVVYFAGAHFERGALPLRTTVEIAHRRGVPVIVDGAAQIPPVANLWEYTTSAGADLAVFSGGKGLRGPQSSGLIVGRADLIEAIRLNGPPNQAIGRPMKVGKEEMVGLVAAVEWYLGQDEPALIERYERQVARVVESVGNIPGLTAQRDFPSEAGQPMPRALVRLDATKIGLDRDEIVRRLHEGDPYVEVANSGKDGIWINPQTLEDGEEKIVIDRLLAALAPARGGRK
ncbi:MAG TPA: aminotransferase class V-fold PLP-dependent enzyme [Chloroflexota bacterium]|nr:aminotransferase class V-fold PLP-dependent enzyme [Chloroflexota bacterium]